MKIKIFDEVIKNLFVTVEKSDTAWVEYEGACYQHTEFGFKGKSKNIVLQAGFFSLMDFIKQTISPHKLLNWKVDFKNQLVPIDDDSFFPSSIFVWRVKPELLKQDGWYLLYFRCSIIPRKKVLDIIPEK